MPRRVQLLERPVVSLASDSGSQLAGNHGTESAAMASIVDLEALCCVLSSRDISREAKIHHRDVGGIERRGAPKYSTRAAAV